MIHVCESCKERFPRLHLVELAEEGSTCEVCGATVTARAEHMVRLSPSPGRAPLPHPPRPAEPVRPSSLCGDSSSLQIGGLADTLASGSLEPDVLPLGTNAGPTLRPVAVDPTEAAPEGPALPAGPPARRFQRHHAFGLAGAVLALGVGALFFVGRTDSSDQLSPPAEGPPTPAARGNYHVGDVPAVIDQGEVGPGVAPAPSAAPPAAPPAPSASPASSHHAPGRKVLPTGNTRPR